MIDYLSTLIALRNQGATFPFPEMSFRNQLTIFVLF